MPWQGVTVEEQRENFIRDWKLGYYSVSELAESFGVSRKTAHKWINRFCQYGSNGYKELPRRPKRSPGRTPQYVVDELLERRRKRKRGMNGTKQVLDTMRRDHPEWPLPSVATVNRIFARHGLVRKRRRFKRLHPGCPKTKATAPNEIWAMDYKGQFKLKNGDYCYPFTVSDLAGRFLLGCEAHASTNLADAKRYLTALFLKYGLPERIRSDNGVPFASNALARLSQLSVWLIKLGIYPELIEPGKPNQNGIHERMHQTLKQAATIPPSATMAAQQRRFDAFRSEFNSQRAHEALGMKRPAEVYTCSPRSFPAQTPEYDYPQHYILRRVSKAGTVRLFKHQFFVATPLAGELIGFEETDSGVYDVFFCFLHIGRYNATSKTLQGVISEVPLRYARSEHA